MTDAPERIWATEYYDQNRSEHTKKWSTCGFDGMQQCEYIRADLARPMTVAEAAKVLLDAMEGSDGMDVSAFMGAADEMARYMDKGLGPMPMLSSALRAMSEGGE